MPFCVAHQSPVFESSVSARMRAPLPLGVCYMMQIGSKYALEAYRSMSFDECWICVQLSFQRDFEEDEK